MNLQPTAIITAPNLFNVEQRGVYELRFTTTINPEQLPLKEIYIDWGDSTYQVISGQDSKPSADNPHIIYHYYNATGAKMIKITATDNWGKFNPSVQ